MPASASPSATFVSTALTSVSWLTGFTVTPALPNVVVEYVPQGTPGAQTSTLIAALARSATEAMCLGLPACTAISSLLCAKTAGVPDANPPVTTFCMLAWSAAAKMSAGAPCWICVTSVGLPAKLNVEAMPGYFRWRSAPILVNASVSEAAASTVRLPLTSGGVGDGWAATPPQAATSSAAEDSRTVSRRGNAASSSLLQESLLDHHVVGLEHGRGDVAYPQLQLAGGLRGDDGRDDLAADVDADLGGHLAAAQPDDLADELVARGQPGQRRLGREHPRQLV